MKYVVIYVVFSIFISFFSYIYHPFLPIANKIIVKNIVWVSRPLIGFLDDIKSLGERYVFLIKLRQENMLLKEKIVKLELQNRLLSGSTCVSSNKKSDSHQFVNQTRVFKAQFKFKNNFNIDYLFLSLKKPLNLKRDVCSVFSNSMNLIGIIDKKINNYYEAKTVFNRSFVADAYIESDNSTYRALFIGDLYQPKAEFLIPNAQISLGSHIYTSGAFGVFPKGSFIGVVNRISNVNSYYKVAYVTVDKSFFNDWTVFVICTKKH